MGGLINKIKDSFIPKEEDNNNDEDDIQVSKKQKEYEEKEKILYGKIDEFFEKSDLNGNGILDSKELKAAIKNYMDTNNNEEIRELYDLIDVNEKVEIKKNDFRKLISLYTKEEPNVHDWIGIYQLFDKDLSGGMSTNEIIYVFSQMGLKLSEKEAIEMVKEVNPKDDEMYEVNFDDFLKIMMSN